MAETGCNECDRISAHPHDDFGAKSTLTGFCVIQEKPMKRIFFAVLWVFAASMVCSAQSTIYFPHIANGVLGSTIWKTTILLTNPAASGTASGTITFNQDNQNIGQAGSPFNISFTDEAGTPTTGTI